MSEENTHEMQDARSFEERVFARFDAIDKRLDKMEKKVDELSYDTKPIWERALKEIAEIRSEMNTGFRSVERQIGVLSKDIVQLRAEVGDLANRVDALGLKS
jgi:predicted  nucleic acid-binding Zn-ribbon protein